MDERGFGRIVMIPNSHGIRCIGEDSIAMKLDALARTRFRPVCYSLVDIIHSKRRLHGKWKRKRKGRRGRWRLPASPPSREEGVLEEEKKRVGPGLKWIATDAEVSYVHE